MQIKKNERFYVGVYEIYRQNNKVLLIKKARGPYKGTFDLPGGGIEFEERIEDTLKRELLEETNGVIKNFKFLKHNELVSEYKNDKGKPRKIHHLGIYYTIKLLPGTIKKDADGEDSLGSEFVDIKKLSEIKISPMAKPMIEKAILNI